MCDSTSVGLPYFAMVCARVIVLPDPVTPSRVWYLSPRVEAGGELGDGPGLVTGGGEGGDDLEGGAAHGGNIVVSGFVREDARQAE